MNVYTITDSQGGSHQLTPGVDFASYVQRIDSAAESGAAHSAPIGSYVPNAVQIAYAALDGFDDNLLARWKITRTVVADPTPPVVRPELPKDVVTQRLIGLGKISAVMTVLRANDAAYALWFVSSWPNVYKDDERVLPILQAAGLTADEIATVMA